MEWSAPFQNSAQIHRHQGKTLAGGEGWVQIETVLSFSKELSANVTAVGWLTTAHQSKMKGIHVEDWLLSSKPKNQQNSITI